MVHISIYFVLLILISCSNGAYVKRGSPVVSAPPVMKVSGVEQFLLAPLPWWANYSTSGNCQRDIPVRYFDLAKLKASYSMSYIQLIHWQVLFNRALVKESGPIGLIKEESLFQNAYAQIKGDVKSIHLPNFERFHFVWVDPLGDDFEQVQRLKDLLAQEDFFQGVPLVISTCLTSWQLEKEWQTKGISSEGLYFVGSEYFSPYDLNIEKKMFISFHPEELVGNKKSIYFYSPNGLIPVDIAGNWEIKKY